MADNFLYYGDNLDILRQYIPVESVELQGVKVEMPPIQQETTFKKAPKAKRRPESFQAEFEDPEEDG